MNKVASYLQSHLSGEVIDAADIRKSFATDGSIFEETPMVVVHPRSTNDIRKVCRFSWQLAEKGHKIPVTPRGRGSNVTGAAIGKGIILSFPAHLNRILELDTQQRLIRVQPGLNLLSLQETLMTHGLFLPAVPIMAATKTVGGAIANNVAGQRSVKYGSIERWVDKLEVILANGEVMQTGRVSKKQVEAKKGLATLEGELYRAVDAAFKDDKATLDAFFDREIVGNVGYRLDGILKKDGSMDLTPLFVGSQGTLGIISEAILRVAPYSAQTELVVASFQNLQSLQRVIPGLMKLKPSILDVVNRGLLEFAIKHQGSAVPDDIKIQGQLPAAVLFIEFDDEKYSQRQKLIKQASKLLDTETDTFIFTGDYEEQDKLWGLREASSAIICFQDGKKMAVPVIADSLVADEKLSAFIESVTSMCESAGIEPAIWGSAGTGSLHLLPVLDLEKTAGRQKAFKIMDQFYRLVLQHDGSVAYEEGEGRLHAPYVRLQLGDDMIAVFESIKHSVDQYDILNPGVKFGTEFKQIVEMMRKDFSVDRFASYLPRS